MHIKTYVIINLECGIRCTLDFIINVSDSGYFMDVSIKENISNKKKKNCNQYLVRYCNENAFNWPGLSNKKD